MITTPGKTKFSTDLFSGALNENEKRNKKEKKNTIIENQQVKQDNVAFSTDSFKAALKIHDDREKIVMSQEEPAKPDVTPIKQEPVVTEQESDVKQQETETEEQNFLESLDTDFPLSGGEKE